jgi:hypothetical protein
VIENVHVFAAYSEGCKSGDCVAPVHDAPHVPDVAIIDIDVDTPDIPIVRVDLNPVSLGDPVTLLGYGCEAHDQTPSPYRLKLQNTTVSGKDSLDTGRRATAIGSYVVTNALNRDPSSATLCPGDSGGPLYRAIDGEQLVVGINALVRGDEDNWDTRLDVDAAYDVAGWLRGFGLQLREPETSPRPFSGVAQAIPGTLQAEDYDRGPRGVAYSDSDRFNQPYVEYRSEAVDIDATQDQDGGFNIGGIQPGEWLSFAVNVASDGEYDVGIRAASPADQSKLHLELDGQPVSGSIVLPSTGGYQQFVTTAVPKVPLEAGTHSLRLVFETSGFNLNWLSFARSATCSDGIKNGAEIDLDCGGVCGGCVEGKQCVAASDCQSGLCTAGVCQVPVVGVGGSSGIAGSGAGGAGAGGAGAGGGANSGGALAAGGLPALTGAAGGPSGASGSAPLAPQAKPTTPDAGCSVSAGSRPLGSASGSLLALALGAAVARSRRRRQRS